MKRLFTAILFVITIINAFTLEARDDEWILVGNKTVYSSQDSEGLQIDANSKWVKLNRIEAPFHKDFPPPAPGYIRKWRVHTRYSDQDPSLKTSYQLKFMTSTFKRPIFSFVRPQGFGGELDSFSDWYQFEDGTSKRTFKGDAALYARLISPPTADNYGHIYSVELQAWDLLVEKEETKSAAGRVLPGMDLFSKTEKEMKKKTREQAEDFAMQVMDTVLSRDKKEFYELLSDRCYSLTYGTLYFKDSLPLYDDLKDATKSSYITMASYEKNYKPRIISYEEYSELFPDWISSEREWRPSENDYLFYGNITKKNGEDIIQSRMAVFMIGFNGNRWEIKAIPQ